MLGDDDHQEVQIMARKADRLGASHGHRMHGGVAAVQEEPQDPAVNALRDGGSGGRGQRGAPAKRGGQTNNNKAHLPPKGAAASSTAPAALARESAGLCYYHWHFGEQAIKCEKPCAWQGN